MQTFLPYPSFVRSAQVLDDKRLGKQRVEGLTILRTILEDRKAWRNHPAVRMWRGREGALWMYTLEVCWEWTKRGFKDSVVKKMGEMKEFEELPSSAFVDPEWLGREDFHLSHQSNLVRKDPVHYRRFFPDVPSDLPYVWPL